MRNVEASIGWYCVHIEHIRLVKSVDITFRNMLLSEYVALGQPAGCRVYRHLHPDNGRSYYFSPEAVRTFRMFVIFWEGFGVSEPSIANLMDMDLILPIPAVSDS